MEEMTLVEILCGFVGPLVAAGASWVVASRTYREHPERLTGVMATAFAVKLVFFGAYVAIALGALSLRAIPFMISFTSSFVVLHAAEAIGLHRLFAGPRPDPAR
jgi:hypothetical protein